MSEEEKFIWVIAHDGGYEGHSGPVQAFRSFDEAKAAAKLCDSDGHMDIFRVPIWPEPAKAWFYVEPYDGEISAV